MNIDMAQGTYFRGMKLALAEIDRRYGAKRIEDDDFVDRSSCPTAIHGSGFHCPGGQRWPPRRSTKSRRSAGVANGSDGGLLEIR